MGYGVYREIKAHELTTEWTLRGTCQNFPLMYEYRILKRSAAEKTNASAEEIQEREQYVEYWDGSSSVRARAEAAQNATYDIVVFLESIPTTLHKRIGKEDLSQANIDQIEKELLLVTHFMKIKGFLHFDAHFHNILTKDNHVYFADFGLALSRNFDLSPEENIFRQKHLDYDRSYVVGSLAESIAKREIKSILPKEEVETELDRFFSLKEMKINLPPTALRYRLIAHLMDNFFRKLREVSKSTPYPANELAKAWTEL